MIDGQLHSTTDLHMQTYAELTEISVLRKKELFFLLFI